jgi:hypothetical protein
MTMMGMMMVRRLLAAPATAAEAERSRSRGCCFGRRRVRHGRVNRRSAGKSTAPCRPPGLARVHHVHGDDVGLYCYCFASSVTNSHQPTKRNEMNVHSQR